MKISGLSSTQIRTASVFSSHGGAKSFQELLAMQGDQASAQTYEFSELGMVGRGGAIDPPSPSSMPETEEVMVEALHRSDKAAANLLSGEERRGGESDGDADRLIFEAMVGMLLDRRSQVKMSEREQIATAATAGSPTLAGRQVLERSDFSNSVSQQLDAHGPVEGAASRRTVASLTFRNTGRARGGEKSHDFQRLLAALGQSNGQVTVTEIDGIVSITFGLSELDLDDLDKLIRASEALDEELGLSLDSININGRSVILRPVAAKER